MDTSIVPQTVLDTYPRKISGIYQIRQLSTGKKYIGSGTDLRRRIVRHRSELNCNRHANRHLQSAWAKYGGEDFLFEVLEIVDMLQGKQRLIEREQWYLDNCVLWETDFNILPTAYSPFGGPISEEARKKISARKKGQKMPESGRQRLRATWKRRKEDGFQVSEDARKNQSAARKGKRRPPLSEEAKQNLRDGWQRRRDSGKKRDKPLSDETRKRMSEANKRRKEQGWKAPAISEETRKKMSEASRQHRSRKKAEGWKAPPMSEEAKRKRSETLRKKKEQGWKLPSRTEEHTQKIVESKRRTLASRKAKRNE